MLKLTEQQMLSIRNRAIAPSVVAPLYCSDGFYILSEATLSDPNMDPIKSVLEALPSVSSWTPYTEVLAQKVIRSNIAFTFSTASTPWSVNSPADGVLRFEARQFDYGYSGDRANRNKRSEVVASGNGSEFGLYQSIWWSSGITFGDAEGMRSGRGQNGYVVQWHSDDAHLSIGRSPVVGITALRGELVFDTRSSALLDQLGNGIAVRRHTMPMPPKGDTVNVVMNFIMGEFGSYKLWVNGSLVVDLTGVPIGYYASIGNYAGRPQFGIYMTNLPSSDVVFHSSVELGLSSLEHRVENPISIPFYKL